MLRTLNKNHVYILFVFAGQSPRSRSTVAYGAGIGSVYLTSNGSVSANAS